MNKSSHQTVGISEPIVLVFDKKGDLGNALVISFRDDIKKVLVSGRELVLKNNQNKDKVLLVPIKKGKIPSIPDYQYECLIVVDNAGENIEDYVQEFLKKAEKERTKLIFITDIIHAKSSFIQRLIDSYKGVYVVIVGEIFAKREIWNPESPMGSVLYHAHAGSGIKIPGMGLSKIYPVFLDDVISAVNKILFSQPSSRVYFLFPKTPITLLSFARVIKKIDPLVRIDFDHEDDSKGRSQAEFDVPKEGEYLLPENYKLQDKLRESGLLGNIDHKNQNPAARNSQERIKIKSGDQTRKNRHLYSVLFFILLVLLMPVLATFFSFAAGGYLLLQSYKAVKKGGLREALTEANISHNSFAFAGDSFTILNLELSVFNLDKYSPRVTGIITDGQSLDLLMKTLAVSYLETENIFAGRDTNYKRDFADAANKMKQAFLVLEKLRTDGLFLNVGKSLPAGLADLSNYSRVFGLIGSVSDNASDIVGIDSKKTYLVLFQNNMELRPGGGFIGSYGLLTFDMGRTDFSIHDVYDADGQLKGHVEPPFPIRRYLSNPNWYLRDSNFDVDFTKDASASAFFLNQETGTVADGVIAVDISFIQNLLKAVGSVYVSDYNENVNADNVYGLTEEHAEKNFFPGSAQKKDFLRALLTAMETRFARGNISYPVLLKALNDSINEKHVLFAFANRSFQNIFTANGVSSSLWDQRQRGEAAFNDFIGVNEANLGANKANYFLKRSIAENISIDTGGEVKNLITVNYVNGQIGWPGGDYKAYLRFVIPFGSIVNGISIDGQKQTIVPAVTNPDMYEAKNFVPPQGLEVDTYNEEGKSIVGFFITVKANKTKTVALSYSSPQKIVLDSGFFTYDLKVFKQPGTDSDPFYLKIAYPADFRVFRSSSKFSQYKTAVSLLTWLDTDKDYNIEFSRK